MLAALLFLAALPAAAGLLSPQGVSVLDGTGAPRQSFSTNETIGFQVAVNNGAASPNRVTFMFNVVAPNGNVVFRHNGNAARGTVGNTASAVTGLVVSGFAQGPGTYTLKATASLDGVNLEQDATFTISSPNLLLIYPPNGSVNLTDNPLTFQWYSSGAATYRVTVGDNPSLYNALFVQTAPAGSNSLTYPQNPSDPRQRLSTGQTYYWGVVGLDVNGNVVAQSQTPFSFSVANTALTRDLAVTALTINGMADASGNIPFQITVANQGNTTESNTPLRVTVGGLSAPGTPLTVPQLSPGDAKTFAVSAPIPTDMASGLVIACLTIFDDNVANNCATLMVSRPTAISSTTFGSQTAQMSAEQIWAAIEQILQDQGVDLSGYNLINMEGSMTQAELAQLLDQLRQGQVATNLSGPPLPSVVPSGPSPTAPVADAAIPPPPPIEPAGQDDQSVAAEQTWSGTSSPMSPRTVAVAVTKEGNWRRLWSRLSADRIQIEEALASQGLLTVRYRPVSYARFDPGTARTAAPKDTVPYILEVIPRTVLKVKFEKVKGGPDE
jgi:hypothetical protein